MAFERLGFSEILFVHEPVAAAFLQAFGAAGFTLARDRPFAGALVPLAAWQVLGEHISWGPVAGITLIFAGIVLQSTPDTDEPMN